uniref:L1 transposable element RRM domain-containing protein n=1 Tax=Xenopus tropicalis TaxID=8364 RepID=A0A803KDP9_XENTR
MGKHSQKQKTEAVTRLERFARTEPQSSQSISPNDSLPPSPGMVAETPEPSPSELLSAIIESRTATTSQLEEIKVDISLLRHDLQNIRERTTEVETRVSTLEDTVSPLPNNITVIKQQLQQALDKTEDLENRLRRNNVRIVGLPEKVEGQNPETFIENWLKQTLGNDTFSTMFVVERAHRVPTRPHPPGAPPRPFLLRMLNYRDRDAALKAARIKGPITFNGTTVSLYPDFSPTIQKQRATFTAIKRRLREAHIPYGMIYPARLRVQDGDRAQFFNSPAEADDWLTRRNPRRSPPRD